MPMRGLWKTMNLESGNRTGTGIGIRLINIEDVLIFFYNLCSLLTKEK